MNITLASRTITPTTHHKTIVRFVTARCQIGAHFGEHHKGLRAAYLAWCDDYDFRPISESQFCEALAALGYTERFSTLARGWNGLRLL